AQNSTVREFVRFTFASISSAPALLALVQRTTRGPFLNGSSQRRLARAFAQPALLLTRKRRHDKHRAGGMSHGAFSHTANERTAQTSSAMRRDNDQIGTFLCSRFVNGAGAVSGNGRRIDRNAIETNALQETFHLITTSAAGCFDIGRRIVIAA